MSNKPHYKSAALEALHSTIAEMNEAGLVDDATLRRFDASCLCSTSEAQPIRQGPQAREHQTS